MIRERADHKTSQQKRAHLAQAMDESFQRLNPYETPPQVEPEPESETEDDESRRHHLSNRVMAVVLGVPGVLLTSFGMVVFVVGWSLPLSSPASTRAICLLIGTVGLTIGIATLAASIYLWRYDSTHGPDESSSTAVNMRDSKQPD